MKTNCTHRRRRSVSLALASACILMLFSGCSGTNTTDPAVISEELTLSMAEVQSVETHITFEMQGTFKNSADYNSHSASIGSDITIQSSFSPLAYTREAYSNILVDGVTTRENAQNYVVKEGNDYLNYEYDHEKDEWSVRTLSRSDILALPGKTGIIQNWSGFMSGLSYSNAINDGDETQTLVYTGTVDSSILNEIFADPIFSTFMTSLEWLVKDSLPCTLYVDGATLLPDHFEIDFHNDFAVTDMIFNTAHLEVRYSDWNNVRDITVPKQAAVMATNPDQAFYSTYYAWNLFLPYTSNQTNTDDNPNQGSQSFTANWDTYQVRIDGGMTSIPLLFEDLQKVGYDLEDRYNNYIMEPNKYVEDVIVTKGQDKIRCTFYNDEAVAQPITSCKIGSIDIQASDIPNNGIKIYLPGEVTLGITRDTLESAYGSPDYSESAFSSDTLTWKGIDELHYFLAEISPITGQVIRLKVSNVPVTGGVQQ